MTRPNQSELEELDRLIIENQSEDGSIDISDQRAMRDEIVAYITANYTKNHIADVRNMVEDGFDEQLDAILAKYEIGFVVGGKRVNEHVAKFKQAINQAVKDHIIADIIGMCLETKHPGEFPSVDALMIRDKIVLKYLVTKGNE